MRVTARKGRFARHCQNQDLQDSISPNPRFPPNPNTAQRPPDEDAPAARILKIL